MAFVVLERVSRALSPEERSAVELLSTSDPTQLLEWLRYQGPVWLIDAVVGAAAGRLLELQPEQLQAESSCSVSSHGIDPNQAVSLSRALYPDETSTAITFLAVTIDPPRRYEEQLSERVTAAAEVCATRLLELLRAPPHASTALPIEPLSPHA